MEFSQAATISSASTSTINTNRTRSRYAWGLLFR